MATQAFVETFGVTTGLGGTTVRTGYGHAPKAVVVFGGVSANATDIVQGLEGIFSVGIATSASARRVVGYRSASGSAAGDSAASCRSTAIADLVGLDGSTSALLDMQSFDSDGWTGVTDDDYSLARRYTVLSIGGDDITNVAIGTIVSATSGAIQAVTGVGFAFDSLLIIGCGRTAEGNGGAPGVICIGVVAGVTAADNACLSGVSQDGADPTVTKSYCRKGESFVSFNGSAALDGRGYVSAKDSDGFEITWNANPSDAKIFYYLAIKGGSFAVVDTLTQTDTTTDIVVSGLSFQPVAGLVLSAGKAESAAGTVDDGFHISIGAFTAAGQNAQAIRDDHNLATSNGTGALDYNSSYLRISATDTLDGEMGVTSIESDGFTSLMSNADPSQAFVAYLLFGSAAGSIINTVTAEDAAEVVDAFVSIIGRLRDSAETTIISEGGLTSSALYNLLTSESVVTQDSFLRHVLANRLTGDSLVLVDSFLSSITGIVVNTVTAEDVITVVDAFVSLIRRMRDSAEATIVSEGGLELTTLYNVIVEESLEITDSFLRRILATRTQADSIVSIDDFLSSVVGQGIVFAIASDAITVTWQALISSYFNRLNEENATTIDALLELSLFNTLASSLTSIIDDSLMQVSKFMSIVDSVDVIDDVASVFLPFTSADGSKIRIGIDQPRIELGGYPR